MKYLNLQTIFKGNPLRTVVGVTMLALLLTGSTAAVLPDLAGTGSPIYGNEPGKDIPFSEESIIRQYPHPAAPHADRASIENMQTASSGDVNITKIGHFGGGLTFDVEVSGNYAFTGEGSDFVVLDISNRWLLLR